MTKTERDAIIKIIDRHALDYNTPDASIHLISIMETVPVNTGSEKLTQPAHLAAIKALLS